MTKAAKEIVKMAWGIDALKKAIPSIKEEAYKIAFPDDNFSGIPLYYIADKHFGDILDVELETIDIVMEKFPFNKEKLKAIVSTMQSDIVWTDAFAFTVALEAFNNMHIDPTTLISAKPDEIAWAMVNIAGLSGAIAMPFKTNVLGTIVASLMDDGWTLPPLFLMFKHITDHFDNEKYAADVAKKLGHLSIKDIINLEDFSGLDISSRPDLQNYLTRTQNYLVGVVDRHKRLLFDLETAINGG